MGKMNKENLWYRIFSDMLYQILVMAAGALLIIIGAKIPEEHGTAKDILIGLGAGTVPGGIVSFFNAALITRKYEEKHVTRDWGLVNIYETRTKMNVTCDEYLQKGKRQISMSGFGFRSLMDGQKELIEKKVREGIKIRIITMNPDSDYVRQREREEGEREGDIRESIINLGKWVEALQKIEKKKGNVQIRYYDAKPIDFYFRIDDHAFTGPYIYGKKSQYTISYEFCGDSSGFDYYAEYYDRLWNDEALMKKEPF